MKSYEESVSHSKIHHAVQAMIAEAKQIINPVPTLPPIFKHNNAHLEVHLPPSKLNNHLKQILKEPSQHYRKIERAKQRSLTRLQNTRQNEETQQVKLLSSSRHQSPSLISKITGKNELTTMLNNFESELLDHRHHNFAKRFKRPLIEKKFINLFPQIPEVKLSKKQRQAKAITQRHEQILKDYQQFITISHQTAKAAKKSAEKSIILQISDTLVQVKRQMNELKQQEKKYKHRQYKSMTLQPKRQEKIKQIHKIEKISPQSIQIKEHKSQKIKKSKQIKVQQERYEPWLFEQEAEQPEEMY